MEKKTYGIFFNIEKIEIICFNSGICFFTMKTNIEGSNEFYDVLDFNYKFKDINSELSNLKNFENIRIQTDTFKDVKDISELISQITGISKGKVTNKSKEIIGKNFYTFAYNCLESEHWNDRNDLDNILPDFFRYSNVLPSNYSSDFNKECIESNLSIIDRFKYYRIAVTRLSSNLLCSGMDTYNFTKLPYEYENEYFYTYVIDENGKLIMAPTSKMKNGMGHTSLSVGRPVKYAGTIKFSKSGKLDHWTNASGHYEPSAKDASTASNLLRKNGLKDANLDNFKGFNHK